MVIKESQLMKLRSALDYKETEVKNNFSEELLRVAHSIALTATSLYLATKSVITARLPTVSNLIFSDTACGSIVIEMPAIIMIKGKCNAEKFYDFSMILCQHIMV